MTFADRDVRPNREIPLALVRVGNSSDTRWREVPAGVERIDSTEVHRITLGHTWILTEKSRRDG